MKGSGPSPGNTTCYKFSTVSGPHGVFVLGRVTENGGPETVPFPPPPPRKIKFSYIQTMTSAKREINLDRTQCAWGGISAGKVAWDLFFKELLSEQRPKGRGGGHQVEREELCQAQGKGSPEAWR